MNCRTIAPWLGDRDDPHFQLDLLDAATPPDGGDGPRIRVSAPRAPVVRARLSGRARGSGGAAARPSRARSNVSSPRIASGSTASAHRRCATARRRSRFRPRSWRCNATRRNAGACTSPAERGGCGWPSCGARSAPGRRATGAADHRRGDGRSLRQALRRWLMSAARDRLEPRVAALAARDRSAIYPGVHAPAAYALGQLLRAGYHQPQLLPAVPAPRSGATT